MITTESTDNYLTYVFSSQQALSVYLLHGGFVDLIITAKGV